MSVPITISGNVTSDPELKFTASSVALVNFSVAVNDRIFDKNTNEWKDGETSFYRCTAFRQLAEHISETVTKGMRVIVQGKIEQKFYETQAGEKKSDFQILADDVGPSLKNATAQVSRVQRSDAGAVASQRNDDPWTSSAKAGQANNDPWAAASTTRGADSPPF